MRDAREPLTRNRARALAACARVTRVPYLHCSHGASGGRPLLVLFLMETASPGPLSSTGRRIISFAEGAGDDDLLPR